MAFSRVNGPGWSLGDQITSAQLNALDVQLTNALDKTAAGDTISGTVTVVSPGSISAAAQSAVVALVQYGINSATPGGIGASVAGGIASRQDGGISLSGTVNDWITYGRARTVTRVAPCIPTEGLLIDGSGTSTSPALPLNGSFAYTHQFPPSFGQSIFGSQFGTSSIQSSSFKANAFCLNLNPFLQDGSTLGTATLTYLTSTKGALPYGQPFLMLYRVSSTLTSGTGFSTFFAMGTPTVAQDNASSVAAYSNQSRSLAQTITAYNVIDKSQYNYIAIVGDEYGANATSGNAFGGITLTQTVHDSRPA